MATFQIKFKSIPTADHAGGKLPSHHPDNDETNFDVAIVARRWVLGVFVAAPLLRRLCCGAYVLTNGSYVKNRDSSKKHCAAALPIGGKIVRATRLTPNG